MDKQIAFFYIVLLLVLTLPGIIYYYINTGHKERMELIKKGDYAFQTNYLENLRYSVLSKGIMLVSLAVGFGIGYAITRGEDNTTTVVSYIISVLGSCGVGLLVYYAFISKISKNA